MKVTRFDSEELQPYIEFMLSQLRKTDSFWFLGVENTIGYDAAIKMNEGIWQTMGKVTAREIREKFSLHEKGLKGLSRFFRYFPWAMISAYEIVEREDEVIVSVPHCPSQEARLKQGLGEYDCKEMHFLFFSSIIQELDKDLKVECLFAPPDPHGANEFCKWRFTVDEERSSG
jgi:hypothetical protein